MLAETTAYHGDFSGDPRLQFFAIPNFQSTREFEATEYAAALFTLEGLGHSHGRIGKPIARGLKERVAALKVGAALAS